MRVLVVDDEPAVRDSLLRALRFEGYDPTGVSDGMQALDALAAQPYDAVVLDVMMPRLSGVETCRRMRARGDATPVLMLTARDDVPSRVAGLDAGADDYLPKPFALEELLARVRALLRRSAAADAEEEVLRLADLELHPSRRTAVRAGSEIALTRTEFDLLEQLLRHRGKVLTRSALFERVWGHDFGATSNTLDVYIGYLRRKTEAGGASRLVHTVRGVGFVAREPS